MESTWSNISPPSSPPPPKMPVGEASLPDSYPLDDGPAAGSSTEKPIVRLDGIFNFQIIVFQVEDTLFQVLKNGFNVPGTPFQGMFALAQTTGLANALLEGNSLDNPIVLEGVKAAHFRSFLRILYPFIGQTTVFGYDDWIGVLHLATMWFFAEIRGKAISALTELIKQKSVFERIDLAREYQIPTWLQEAYVELAQKRPLTLTELQPTSFALDWETIAKLFYIRETATDHVENYCYTCGRNCGPSSGFCSCNVGQLVTKIMEVFRQEFAEMEAPGPSNDPPLPLPSMGSDPITVPDYIWKEEEKEMKIPLHAYGRISD